MYDKAVKETNLQTPQGGGGWTSDKCYMYGYASIAGWVLLQCYGNENGAKHNYEIWDIPVLPNFY